MASGSFAVKIMECDNSQDLQEPPSLKFLIIKLTSENEEIMKINIYLVKKEVAAWSKLESLYVLTAC